MRTLFFLTLFFTMHSYAFELTKTRRSSFDNLNAVWSCELSGEVSGRQFGFYFSGRVNLHGHGKITCRSSGRNDKVLFVLLNFYGKGSNFGYAHVHGGEIHALRIPAEYTPKEILGSYSISTGKGSTVLDNGPHEPGILVDNSAEACNEAKCFIVGLIGDDATSLGVYPLGQRLDIEVE